MIWRPVVGTRVVLCYRESLRRVMALHGQCGVVQAVGCGPGPINCAIVLDAGATVVVPRGNLRAVG